MAVIDVQGVSPQVAAYLGVVPSCDPISEAQLQELNEKIRSVIGADDSLADLPDLLKFDNALLDAVALALRLVMLKGGEGERHARAGEKLDAIPALCKAYVKRQRTRKGRGGTQVGYSSSLV